MSESYQERLKRIKATYPRAYEQWSAEDESLLTDMSLADCSVAEMSEALERRPSAIRSRLRRMAKQSTKDTSSTLDFYDEKYGGEGFFWGRRPSAICYRVLELFPAERRPTLLDAGCGEGRNAIFFARNGFAVTAFDLSAVGVDKTKEWAAELGLAMSVFQADVNEYRLEKPWDVIFSLGSLQFVPAAGRGPLLEHYRAFTRPGGLNVHTVPVVKPFLAPTPEDDEAEQAWRSGELMSHYHDWRILYVTEEILDYERDGLLRQWVPNRIIAQKPDGDG